jgi:hypothetical protein
MAIARSVTNVYRRVLKPYDAQITLTPSVSPTVRKHETAQQPLEGFP